MKRRVYCLAVMESLSPVGSMESFRATLTKNLSNDCCFCLLFRISRKCHMYVDCTTEARQLTLSDAVRTVPLQGRREGKTSSIVNK
jgi:hypothetical protein